MKYVLLLSFSYKKFKDKTGEIKININNRLIDCIKLDQDIKLKQVTLTTRDLKTLKKTKHPHLRPEKIYYYEIDDNDLLHEDQENTLNISVKNDNNNYTNGFMTKDSLMTIENIWFLPLSLFDPSKIQKIHDRLRNARWNKYDYSARVRLTKDRSEMMKQFYHDEYAYDIPWEEIAMVRNENVEYTKERWLYRRFHSQQRGMWPGIVHPLEYVHASGNKKIPNYSRGYTVGGSFDVSLPIRKKHKIFSIRQKNYRGAPMISESNFFATMIEILKGSHDCTIINKSTLDAK